MVIKINISLVFGKSYIISITIYAYITLYFFPLKLYISLVAQLFMCCFELMIWQIQGQKPLSYLQVRIVTYLFWSSQTQLAVCMYAYLCGAATGVFGRRSFLHLRDLVQQSSTMDGKSLKIIITQCTVVMIDSLVGLFANCVLISSRRTLLEKRVLVRWKLCSRHNRCFIYMQHI